MTSMLSPKISLTDSTAVATLGIELISSLPVATSLLAALPCISVVERTAIEWLIGPISTLAHENSKIKDKVSNNSFFIYNSFIDKCM